jgi:hypothetical protein
MKMPLAIVIGNKPAEDLVSRALSRLAPLFVLTAGPHGGAGAGPQVVGGAAASAESWCRKNGVTLVAVYSSRRGTSGEAQYWIDYFSRNGFAPTVFVSGDPLNDAEHVLHSAPGCTVTTLVPSTECVHIFVDLRTRHACVKCGLTRYTL